MIDEKQTINRLLSGDFAAIETIVNAFEIPVYQYCLQFLGSRNEAEDAAVEVFVRLFSNLKPEMAEGALRRWVMEIAVTVCNDWQRHHRPRRLETDTMEKQIIAALQRLMKQQRTLILLRDMNGLEIGEIGMITGLEERTVHLRLARARSNLCEFLQQAGADLAGGKVRYARGKQEQQYHELCSRYVDECVTAEEKADLLDHIDGCTACASYLQNLTQIGRELTHRMSSGMPEGLKDDILSAVQLHAERSQQTIRRQQHIPLMILVAFAAVFVLLIGSGLAGGLFVNSDDAYGDGLIAAGSAGTQAGDYSVDLSGIELPEEVVSNSYSFAVGAEGGTGLPELTTKATLIAVSSDSRVAFYQVENDIAGLEQQEQLMEKFGFTCGPVVSSQISISGDAPCGLLVVVRSED